jgi:hypothetical protein
MRCYNDSVQHPAFVLCCVADTRGRLVKATRLKGIQDFKAGAFGLHPIAVDSWGHFVFLHLQGGGPVGQGATVQAPLGVAEWLGMWMGHCLIWGSLFSCVKLLIVITDFVGWCGPYLSTHARYLLITDWDGRVAGYRLGQLLRQISQWLTNGAVASRTCKQHICGSWQTT